MYTEVPIWLHGPILAASLLPFGASLFFVPWEWIRRKLSGKSSNEQ